MSVISFISELSKSQANENTCCLCCYDTTKYEYRVRLESIPISPFIPMRPISTLTCCHLFRTHYCYWNQSMCPEWQYLCEAVQLYVPCDTQVHCLYFPWKKSNDSSISQTVLGWTSTRAHQHANEFTTESMSKWYDFSWILVIEWNSFICFGM